MRSAEKEAEQRATVLRHLARSLAEATTAFERNSTAKLQTFPDYKKARASYMEIQAMIFTIQDKAAEAYGARIPEDMKLWLVRMRLRAIASFVRLSVIFFRNPPALLVQALGAYEILEMERESLSSLLLDYDMMLMEAAVDDKTSEELDQVRVDMEEVVQLLEGLLKTAPPPLATFS
ncbi:hypothetical protein [Indioceanicola profundi]|uniref:hypothetical protein n=1 Tax=Indioceanicola profundi TaxID=2220096 RepID=UPI000E6AD495|nr:hypothetical protein [Indioceanicola profundi]